MVMRLARVLRQMRDESVGLSPNQTSAMATLLNHGDQRIGDLAARELVRPPSMTRIVNGLEDRGYVTRRSDPHDRRQSVISLTDSGRRILYANRRRRDAWLAVRLADLDPGERATLRQAAELLDRVMSR